MRASDVRKTFADISVAELVLSTTTCIALLAYCVPKTSLNIIIKISLHRETESCRAVVEARPVPITVKYSSQDHINITFIYYVVYVFFFDAVINPG